MVIGHWSKSGKTVDKRNKKKYNDVEIQKGGFDMAGTKITMSLSDKTLETLKQLAEAKGMKKSAIVALALAEFAEKQKGEVHEGK